MLIFRNVIVGVAWVASALMIYSWWASRTVPSESDLVTLTEQVARVDYAYDRSHDVTGVKFWIPNDGAFFFYGSFLPNFRLVRQNMVPGTGVTFETKRDKHQIYSLRINGEMLADFNQVVEANRENGRMGLVASAVFAVAGLCLGYLLRNPRPRLVRIEQQSKHERADYTRS